MSDRLTEIEERLNAAKVSCSAHPNGCPAPVHPEGIEKFNEWDRRYRKLVTEGRGHGWFSDSADVAFLLARVRELEAERDRVKALIHERTFAETLARTFDGALFPQWVAMDDLRAALGGTE